jgi:glutamine synthetase
MQFLVFLCAVIRAVDLHSDLLRASIATAGNDHRLGANEAPPAIMSIFLGEMLTDILNQLETGKPKSTVKGGTLALGSMSLPQIPRHSGDRNRTSPFAFTGNKFEFRAVGSTAAVAWPNTVLNTIIAESIDFIVSQLEKTSGKKPTKAKIESSVRSTLKQILKKHRRVCFDGDGYSEEWPIEAAKRGLPNIPSGADALAAFKSKTSTSLFKKYSVLSSRELKARADVLYENYATRLEIEARTLVTMVRTEVLPATLRYQAEVADVIGSTQVVGVDCPETEDTLREIVVLAANMKNGATALDSILKKTPSDPAKHAQYMHDRALKVMITIREACDSAEEILPMELWPMASYAQMLLMGR